MRERQGVVIAGVVFRDLRRHFPEPEFSQFETTAHCLYRSESISLDGCAFGTRYVYPRRVGDRRLEARGEQAGRACR